MKVTKKLNSINVAIITGITGVIFILISITGFLLSNISVNYNKDSVSVANNIDNTGNSNNGVNNTENSDYEDNGDNRTSIVNTDIADDVNVNNADSSAGNILIENESDNININEKDNNANTSRQNMQNGQDEAKLVPYNGPIRHIYFNPLVAYTQLAFDGDSMTESLNKWYITVKEFKGILNSLYEKGYILIDIRSIFEEKEENGNRTITKKELLLPEGKRPLIISIDNNCYYEYMKKNGTVHKLILGSDGNIWDYSVSPEGKEVISRDNDIIPIVDKFVEEHPDFSFRGAKGIIALTGYEGILGYRMNNRQSPDFKKEKEEVSKLVKRLKETGWTFACQSYNHVNIANISLDALKEDTNKWKEEVGSIVGPTPVYVFPFGSRVKPGDEKFRYLLDSGFNVLCAIGDNDYIHYGPDYIEFDRIHIDGIAFQRKLEVLSDMFNIEDIIDEARP